VTDALVVSPPAGQIEALSLKLSEGVMLTEAGATLAEDVTFDNYCLALQSCQTLGNASLWAIGDMLLFGSRKYGEQYSQALELTKRSYSTLTQAKRLAKAYPSEERHPGLSWTHHREALAVKDTDERRRLLVQAENEGWSREQVRDHVTGADTSPVVEHAHTCPACGHQF